MQTLKFRGTVYPILDTETLKRRNIIPEEAVLLWLHSGLTYYQLRSHDLNPEEYTELAYRLHRKFPQMSIIANDHIEAVFQHPEIFSGIHVGQEDLAQSGEEGKAMLLSVTERGQAAGISTHNVTELKRILPGECGIPWTYIALGPLFPTATKEKASPVLTDEDLARFAMQWNSEKKAGKFPDLVMIGGVNSSYLKGRINEIRKAFPDEDPGFAIIGSALDSQEISAIRRIMSYKSA